MDEQHRRVLERATQSRVDYVFFDSAWRILDYNPEIAAWIDVPQRDLRGLPLWEVFPEFIGLEDHLPTPGAETPLTVPRVQRLLPDGEKTISICASKLWICRARPFC